MNMIILYLWYNFYIIILIPICLVHVIKERAQPVASSYSSTVVKKICLKLCTYLTVEFFLVCLQLRNRLFPRPCPTCVIGIHFVAGECIVFFIFILFFIFLLVLFFYFCIRICIIVLDILTFQDRFLYLYKAKIRRNKL